MNAINNQTGARLSYLLKTKNVTVLIVEIEITATSVIELISKNSTTVRRLPNVTHINSIGFFFMCGAIANAIIAKTPII